MKGTLVPITELKRVRKGQVRDLIKDEPDALRLVAGPDVAVILHRAHGRAAAAGGDTAIDVFEENPRILRGGHFILV
jgi:hypothetical protein